MAKKKSFLLRIDPELYDQVQRWADDEFRSVNGQIEFLLRDALRKSGRKSGKKNDTSD
ncbi:MAG: Arc family DNA-binding protein [Sporolactobacillus sp.]|uniref:ribbon-helix-helix domain-containing protein n=1 Tax=Sporolactobacillus sp. STSJ-5 TaxID=2965076 RepID=UPI002107CDB0|nr:Arc family DNA-binding protein [Sporolactobacillus sp. STSJ-5]MCQ2009017.1 Arc family DNA-binding protein [Sporolactobacillus sp. STSJ-5]